jgi:hypothetical protein
MMFQCCSESQFLMPYNHSNKDVNVMAWASNFPFMLDVLAISPCPAA